MPFFTAALAQARNRILHPRPQHRRRERQRRILLVVDVIHALRLRIIAMPVRPRVRRILRHSQSKNRTLVRSRLDGDASRLVRNRAPTRRHLQLQPVNEQRLFRSIVKIHRDQKLLSRRNGRQRVRLFLREVPSPVHPPAPPGKPPSPSSVTFRASLSAVSACSRFSSNRASRSAFATASRVLFAHLRCARSNPATTPISGAAAAGESFPFAFSLASVTSPAICGSIPAATAEPSILPFPIAPPARAMSYRSHRRNLSHAHLYPASRALPNPPACRT